MKKTSVYLSDEDRERLRRLAEREGVSQAMVLREAIAAYDANDAEERGRLDESLPEGVTTHWRVDETGHRYRVDLRADGTRYFAIDGSGEGDGRSIADIPEEELMAGFGED